MSNFSKLIFPLPTATKRTLRSIEQNNKKILKCKYALVFNKTCIKENILPKYTNIKLNDPATRQQDFTKEFRRKLVEHEIKKKEDQYVFLQQRRETLRKEYAESNIEPDLRSEIDNELHNLAESAERNAKRTATKKLSNLYGGSIVLPEEKNGFVNLSSVTLRTRLNCLI